MTDIDLKDVLERVAAITGAKSDSAISSELGVSPQTLATWKSRGKIPYEQICEFAEIRNVSLDYLLLGRKEEKTGIDIGLFRQVQQALKSDYSELRELNAVDFGYHAAVIYNQVAQIEDPRIRWKTIATSVIMAGISALRRHIEHIEKEPGLRQLPGGEEFVQKALKTSRQRIEELERLIDNPPEPPSSPGQGGDNKAEPIQQPYAETSVTQKIKGTGHQIAGRDVINHGRGGGHKK